MYEVCHMTLDVLLNPNDLNAACKNKDLNAKSVFFSLVCSHLTMILSQGISSQQEIFAFTHLS
jgi:hypothetical protein